MIDKPRKKTDVYGEFSCPYCSAGYCTSSIDDAYADGVTDKHGEKCTNINCKKEFYLVCTDINLEFETFKIEKCNDE